eukprot:CAMPEP_0115261244 /NCGR_PEP_ID=MMETSP0270-20121206/48761_1 /TAXON_ID=71861 /ORGANISM="Scrippsiella trochoidea, Strain CCMP3099" /LENGTH=217 /DNA_ID=CAMNT_0002677121 /DNA_START=8 /DNA_END=659 /DNA_ORIENTATION=-
MRQVLVTLCLLHLAACRVVDLDFLKTAETEDPPGPYLITSNPHSYVCDAQTVARATTRYLACLQPDPETNGTLACLPGLTISCFVYASFGSVSGSCLELQQGKSCGTCDTCVWQDRCSYSTGGFFNNAVDCWGEGCVGGNSTTPACAAYFPEAWGEACIGKGNCFIGYVGGWSDVSEKKWVKQDGSEKIPFSETGESECPSLPWDGKLKVLAFVLEA